MWVSFSFKIDQITRAPLKRRKHPIFNNITYCVPLVIKAYQSILLTDPLLNEYARILERCLRNLSLLPILIGPKSDHWLPLSGTPHYIQKTKLIKRIYLPVEKSFLSTKYIKKIYRCGTVYNFAVGKKIYLPFLMCLLPNLNTANVVCVYFVPYFPHKYPSQPSKR